MINRGPVDVIVMAVGSPHFNGAVFDELKKQAAKNIIRVLDAMVLLKNEAGTCWKVSLEELPAAERDAVGFIAGETRGLFDSEDESTLAEGMVPGSAVVALAIEHVWAIDLVNALYDAGVETALNYRVPATVVDEAFASLTPSK